MKDNAGRNGSEWRAHQISAEAARLPVGTLRIVVAGTHSGCGKTTTASGIMAALTARGMKVQPFKVGPGFYRSFASHGDLRSGVAESRSVYDGACVRSRLFFPVMHRRGYCGDRGGHRAV